MASSTTRSSCSPPTTALRRHLPGRRHHPVQGSKMNTWKAACALRVSFAGRASSSPGTVKKRHLRVARLAAHACQHCRRSQGRCVEQADHACLSGHRQDQARGVDQTEYLSDVRRSRRADTFFYYSSSHPSAVRYKNWKMYFAIVARNRDGLHLPGVQGRCRSRHGKPQRDPFEMGGATRKRRISGRRRARRAVTAYIYDWNLLRRAGAVAEGAGILQGVSPPSGSGELHLDQVMEQLKERVRGTQPVARMLAGDAGAPTGVRHPGPERVRSSRPKLPVAATSRERQSAIAEQEKRRRPEKDRSLVPEIPQGAQDGVRKNIWPACSLWPRPRRPQNAPALAQTAAKAQHPVIIGETSATGEQYPAVAVGIVSMPSTCWARPDRQAKGTATALPSLSVSPSNFCQRLGEESLHLVGNSSEQDVPGFRAGAHRQF